jgi:hypothetical protein
VFNRPTIECRKYILLFLERQIRQVHCAMLDDASYNMFIPFFNVYYVVERHEIGLKNIFHELIVLSYIYQAYIYIRKFQANIRNLHSLIS